MIQEKFLKKFISTFPEFKYHLESPEDIDFYKDMWSVPIENLAIHFSERYSNNDFSAEEINNFVKKWANLANEAYEYSSEQNCDSYDPSYGYFLAFEVFATYEPLVELFKKYLSSKPLDVLLDLVQKRVVEEK